MEDPTTITDIISDDRDLLILVDSSDEEIGELDKEACHDGSGKLHRAISVFIFNRDGDLLIQQRHAQKRLWGSAWSNSCCSHPRVGEETDVAARRRVAEELGLETPLRFLFKFEYRSGYDEIGTEHELCSVYEGQVDCEPIVNTNEIQAWEWVSSPELNRRIEQTPNDFTPWLRIEWARINDEFSEDLLCSFRRTP
ncbi:MAG: isopentenyl-diphosphate Delta-isomerase [Pseudomonadales bacterium]|jgi:isopentenyl-diphosphate delta-isomerase